MAGRFNGYTVHVPTALIAVGLTIASSWLMNACNKSAASDTRLFARVEAAERYIGEHKIFVDERIKQMQEIAVKVDTLDRKVDDARERLIRIEEGQRRIWREVK